MSITKQIYVSLLGEGVDVWRPVQAEQLCGNVYRIVAQAYDRELEVWQFEPGDSVVCEQIESSDGRILAATRPAPSPNILDKGARICAAPKIDIPSPPDDDRIPLEDGPTNHENPAS